MKNSNSALLHGQPSLSPLGQIAHIEAVKNLHYTVQYAFRIRCVYGYTNAHILQCCVSGQLKLLLMQI